MTQVYAAEAHVEQLMARPRSRGARVRSERTAAVAGTPGTLVQPTVAIVGLGYVGLPTALSLLDAGARVLGLDVSPARIAAITPNAWEKVEVE